VIKIRRAKPAEALKIRNAHAASVRGLCAADYTSKQITAWTNRKPEEFRRAMTMETMFIAYVGKKTAGFSATRDGEIRAVYVRPCFSRRGVGKALLRAAEDAACDAGFTTLRLSSSITAHSFYKNHGYRTIKKSRYRFRDGTAVPCIDMKKRLR
jgi:ribosomal protein S18 acetylase RimI-like enzyme